MWQDVLQNADKQRQNYSAVPRKLEIEAYYPELHAGSVAGFFTNTSGSHLIPDLITSPHVVVDLYDFRAEGELISKYGVDKDFLLNLQEKGLVTIAANLEPERYEASVWMHDILADPRTIFRSVRTPLHLESSYPDIQLQWTDTRDRLETWLRSLPAQDFDSIAAAVQISRTRVDERGLASQLAWKLTRVEALTKRIVDRSNGEIGYPLDELFNDPNAAVTTLNRDHLLIVSPTSAGLGGTYRMSYQTLQHLFVGATKADVMFTDVAFVPELNRFLVEQQLRTDAADLSSEKYWRTITEYDKKFLIAKLEDNGKRRDLLRTERNLRARIARVDETLTVDEIKDLVDADIRLLEGFEYYTGTGINYAYAAFCYYLYERLKGVSALLGAAAGTGGILAGRVAKAGAREVMEYAFPRIQVANFIRFKK
jgi:hypothetical protein